MLPAKTPGTVYAFVAVALFIIIGIAGALHHELWLDEASTFLAARDTRGWKGFYEVFRYDGNPWLSFILVKAWVMAGGGVFGMQMINLLVMALAVFIFWQYAPSRIWEKAGITAGYFFMYEYTIISRNYGAGVLLLFLALVLLHRKKYIAGTIVACLCFQTHLHFFLLAFFIAGQVLYTERKQIRGNSLWICISMICLGVLGVYLQVKDAGQHGYFQYTGYTAFSPVVVQRALAMPLRAFLPLSNPVGFSRDGNLLLLLPRPLLAILACMSIVFPFLVLRKSRGAFLYFAMVLASVLFLSCISAQPAIQMRHCGTLWIGFLVALWKLKQAPGYMPGSHKGFIKYAVGLSFLVHIYAAALALYMDYRYPFSEGKNTAAYLDTFFPHEKMIVVGHHFNGPPIAAYMDRSLYYPERHDTATYCIWSTRPFMLDNASLAAELQHLLEKNQAGFLLVINDELMISFLEKSFTVELLARFDESLVRSENFYVCRLSRPEFY